MERSVAEKYYDERQAQYEDFRQAVENLLKTLLKEKEIPFHSVGGRLKERQSFGEKMERKGYERPEQIMDLAGLRVITQTTVEVAQVCKVIEDEFEVDEENSVNKATEMGVDKVGYLSVHYVVRMLPERLKLAEYSRFKGLCCEIQVRSLLQHAWAEIEHDRSYKFSGKLPEEIERRFHLVAGTLELMDQEFRTLVKEIDAYAEQVKKDAKEGKLEIPIDSTSLLTFLNERFKDHTPELLARYYTNSSGELIEELEAFGVHTLQELQELLDSQQEVVWTQPTGETANYIGILRDAMVQEDARKYFGTAWKNHWWILDEASLKHWQKQGVHLEELSDILRVTKDDMGDFVLKSVDSNEEE